MNDKCHRNSKLNKEELTLSELALKYSNEPKARALMEELIWPNGPTCPHCQTKNPCRIKAKTGSKSGARAGLWFCGKCRKQFTVTVGTVLEKSHVPMGKWAMAIFILCSSKKGISAHQLHRMIRVTYRTAWFMFHRLRYASKDGPLAALIEGTAEVDEAFIGGKATTGADGIRRSRKTPVVALIERSGNVKTEVMQKVTQNNLRKFISENTDKKTILNTDQLPAYKSIAWGMARHDTVNHSQHEFSRHNPDGTVSHVNTCESFFSLLKRGVAGAFHHVSAQHLQRYCDEFSFRWNHRKVTDGERMAVLLGQVSGKRLTYRATINPA